MAIHTTKLFLVACCGLLLTHLHVDAQTINDSDYRVNLYFTISNAGPGGGGANDLALAQGGKFGSDLFTADFGTFTGGDGNGRVWRITDSDNDGAGEGTVFASAVGTPFRSPISLTFGLGDGTPFGEELYLLDYSGSTSQRFVYRLDDTGVATQFSTTPIFNPDGLEAHPDGNRLLVNDANTFTIFGGGDDGTVFQVNSSGTVSVWADGSNNPNGLWDINNEAVFSPDGWYTMSNHSIGAANDREIIQFKDLNSDGDANDAGESRVLIGTGAPISQQAGFAFDDDGNLYLSTGVDLYRYTDLNGDGDYWDFNTQTFDADERFLFAEDFGTFGIKAMAFTGSTIFAGVNNDNATTDVYKITRFVPGDTNGDGALDLQDVAPFVALIENGNYLEQADLNEDGVVDLLDVAPFIDLLIG